MRVSGFFASLFLSLLLVLFHSSESVAADAEDDFFQMSLEDVLNIPVDVASKGVRRQTLRTAPGSITVFDAEFIKASGVRDLFELLELVPGNETRDQQIEQSNWFWGPFRYHLIVDGMDMTDRVFGSVFAKDHYPATLLERVEIIRGPGSVMYGDTAMAGVVYVTTRRAELAKEGVDFAGLASTDLGVSSDGLSHARGAFDLALGNQDTSVNVQADMGRIDGGSGTYTDFDGNTMDMHRDHTAYPKKLYVTARHGDFTARYLEDQHEYETRNSGFGVNPVTDVDMDVKARRWQVKYAPQITDDLSAAFEWLSARSRPVCNTDSDGVAAFNAHPNGLFSSFCQELDSDFGVAELNYDFDEKYSLFGGYRIVGEEGHLSVPALDIREDDPFSRTQAVYAQATADLDYLTVILGIRHEWSNLYDSATVSRLALTKAERTWHAKLQVAQAFRAPEYYALVSQYDPNDPSFEIKPETFDVIEGEIGHELGENAYLTLNGWYGNQEDTVEYFFDPGNPANALGDSYRNAGDIGAMGAGAELRYHFNRGEAKVAYNYIRRAGNTADGTLMTVFDQDGFTSISDHKFRGVSPHSLLVHGTVHITEDTSVFSSYRLQSSMWNITGGFFESEWNSPRHTWNANVRFEKVALDNLTIVLGLFNILDEQLIGEGGLNAPMPKLGREGYINAILEW